MTLHLSISALLDPLLDLLLPRSCLLCGTTLQATRALLCPGCTHGLPRLPVHACPLCATPLPVPAPACAACLRSPPAFDATLSALRYDFPIDRLVQQLKFGGRRTFHRLASADFLASAMLHGTHPAGAMLIPVPLSPLRLRERGFNQAVEIARPLARTLRLPLDTRSLTRVRETVPQSLLPWRARKGNLRHAFACSTDFSGRTLIVVDDVMTTGATLDAIARTLKDHGAARVVNWVAARAVKRSNAAI